MQEEVAPKRYNLCSPVTDNPIRHDHPRAISVAIFRTTARHDYVASHLHRIGVLPSPVCPLCGHELMNAAHLPDSIARPYIKLLRMRRVRSTEWPIYSGQVVSVSPNGPTAKGGRWPVSK